MMVASAYSPAAPGWDEEAESTSRFRLAQPVVCTGIGAAGVACLADVAAEFPASGVPLATDERAAALTLTIIGEGEDDRAGGEENAVVRAVAPSELRGIVRRCLQQFLTPNVRYVRWLVVLDLADDGARTALERDVLPIFIALNHENPAALTLTVVCLDTSEEFESPYLPLYRNLARRLSEEGVATACQCYLARRRLYPAGLLDDAAFPHYAALCCYALILGSVPGVPPAFAVNLYQNPNPPGIRVAPEEAPVFGRLAVQRVRSLAQLVAERCAQQALYAFKERQAPQGAQVRVGWDPPRYEVRAPDATPQTVNVVAQILQRGPNARLPGPPQVFGDADAQYEQLEKAVTGWEDRLAAWQREVRIQFASALREVRGSAAAERDHGRTMLEQNVGTLWTERAIVPPLPYITKMLTEQGNAWEDDGRKISAPAALGGTRTAHVPGAIGARLAAIRAEMAYRPHISLLPLAALAAAIFGVGLLWSLLGGFGRLVERYHLAGPDIAARLLVWKIGAAIVVVLAIGFVVMTAWLGARARWDRAYTDLQNTIRHVERAEAQSLGHERDLINRHWYTKTIASCGHHLARVWGRVATAAERMRAASPPRAAETLRNSWLNRAVPEERADIGAEEEALLALVGTEAVDARLRGTEAAQWLQSEPEVWDVRAKNALRKIYAAQAIRRGHADAARIAAALETAMEQWPEIAALLIGGGGTMEHAFISTGFAPLSEGASLAGGSTTFDSPRDELLLCAARTGLDAATAAR